MASTTDIRKWARDHGLDPGVKGPVAAEVRAQYDAAHDGEGQAPGADPPAADLFGADPGADVATAAAPPSSAPADPRQAERVPTRPRASAGARGRGILSRFGGTKTGGKSKAAGKRPPRVSIANLIEDAWGQMAWSASPLPPMQRLLQAQAPFAGIALEDALAGTVIDRALQPVARAEDKAKAVGGLIMPPVALMLVMATAPVPQQVDQGGPEPVLMWPEPTTQHKGALMTLRWSLMLWSEAGAARLDEYKARAEASADRGRAADTFMAWILGYDEASAGGPTLEGEAAATAEDEAVAAAQAMFGEMPGT